MNYRAQLLKEHSRRNTDAIAKAIGNSDAEFEKLIHILYNGVPPIPQRASWVLAAVNANHPELLIPYIGLFVKTVKDFQIDGIKRNIMVVLASQAIPEKLQARLVDICYDFMLAPEETVVVKVHAMQVIANIARLHPALKGELKSVIEDQLPKNTAAFSARARRIWKELDKSKYN